MKLAHGYKLVIVGLLLNGACKVEQNIDLVVWNGKIYTADSVHSVVEAMAVSNGRIFATGTNEAIKKLSSPSAKLIDLKGQFVMPGLIDAHGHFIGLGESVLEMNLLKTQSWQEILDSVKSRVALTPRGQWIVGRGWHQEKWIQPAPMAHYGYPRHDALTLISPDHPVMLYHASGHALLANAKAMQAAGVRKETASPKGGRIIKDDSHQVTGIFEENAMQLIVKAFEAESKKIGPEELKKRFSAKALAASEHCLKYGVTSFHDAGSTWTAVQWLRELAVQDVVKPRLYAMFYGDDKDVEKYIDSLPIVPDAHYKFQSRAIKAYIDGALGSHGAWLHEAYHDKHHHYGHNIFSLESLDRIAALCWKKNIQLCVHGIGDRANREILDIFEKYATKADDRRWRIEHAQHLLEADIKRFSPLGVIASMQTIHCTSDAPFVVKRLGYKRAKEGAYVWRSLIDSGARFANGTDCPVESINPFENIYAAVTRKRLGDQTAFFPEQSLTRLEALHSYTIWNAYAAFEESIKGSLEKGKLADFIVLDTDLLSCPVEDLPKAQVLSVFMAGKKIR